MRSSVRRGQPSYRDQPLTVRTLAGTLGVYLPGDHLHTWLTLTEMAAPQLRPRLRRTSIPPPCRPPPTSRQSLARQADTGLAHHRSLPIDDLVGAPVYDWAAANQRKVDAVQQLAPLSDALDDLEVRIAELAAKTKDLQLD